MNIVWMLLAVSAVLVGISIVIYGPKALIDVAWERNGKWLVAAEIVNTICILIAGGAILALAVAGLERVFERYFYALLVSAGALAYITYFYITRDEAKTKTQLTPKKADEIINQYGAALEVGLSSEDIAIKESALPYPKERVKQAVKIALAFQIRYASLKEEDRSQLVAGLMYLGRFVPDAQADLLNHGDRGLGDPLFNEFVNIKADSALEIKAEMDEFVAQIETLDSIDPLFHQKVYTLAGLEYSSSVKARWNEDYLDARR